MQSTCPKCLTENRSGRLYCGKCSAILEPRTDLWLRLVDFQCPADKEALDVLKSTGILAYFVDQFFVKPREREQREWLAVHGLLSAGFEDLEMLVQECAYTLCLETLPEVYIIEGSGQPSSFTFGNDNAPVIVVDHRLVQSMSVKELSALLGHEMGHVKSRHLLYHSLANALAQGVAISTSLMGLNLISAGMRLTLLAWHRESEYSADRAGLITSGSPDYVASMFARLLDLRQESISDLTLLPQDIAVMFKSHPSHLERVRAIHQFALSREYAAILDKIDRRITLRAALASRCRFCSASKPVDAVFCPKCNRSQI